MKIINIILIVVALTSCSKKDPAVACKDLSVQFDKATRGYLVGCMSACFRSTVAHSEDPTDKETFKLACETLCRDTIPYDSINEIKSALDETNHCGFDYAKKLANPPTKSDIKE